MENIVSDLVKSKEPNINSKDLGFLPNLRLNVNHHIDEGWVVVDA